MLWDMRTDCAATSSSVSFPLTLPPLYRYCCCCSIVVYFVNEDKSVVWPSLIIVVVPSGVTYTNTYVFINSKFNTALLRTSCGQDNDFN